jgi:DNA-binding MarR family transcriptional regulator
MMRLLAGEARVASDLSTELGMTPSAVSQTTHRLERMGLIERKTDEVDRRVRRIVLSSHGEQLMLERQALRVERARMALASLSENHRRRLIDSLDELIKSVGPGAAPKPDSLVFVAELEQTLLPMPPYSFPETKN